MSDVDTGSDVEGFLRSMDVLLGETSELAEPADPAADSAEDRAVLTARVRRARARSEALGRRVEALGERHQELRARVASAPEFGPPAVHRAIGMIMLIFGLNADQARLLLTVVSWRRATTVEDIADRMAECCQEGEDPSLALTSGDPDVDRTVPLVVRRALNYIETNAGKAITIDDVSAAAGVRTRVLQYTFRRHHGSTPSRHLQRVRMSRAHDDLLTADPTRGDTVGEIATRWQFTHHGRFAVDYRNVYGVSPSETLRH